MYDFPAMELEGGVQTMVQESMPPTESTSSVRPELMSEAETAGTTAGLPESSSAKLPSGGYTRNFAEVNYYINLPTVTTLSIGTDRPEQRV